MPHQNHQDNDKVKKGARFDDLYKIKTKFTLTGGSKEDLPEIASFEMARLNKVIEKNLRELEYDRPTPVQMQGIPLVAAGFDMMACANTGSGKTAVYLLPIVNELTLENAVEWQKFSPRAIIVVPTRELASQIKTDGESFARGTQVSIDVAIGQTSVKESVKELNRHCGISVLVATPGRLNHFIEDDELALDNVRFLVLDEADRMLDMGFEADMRKLVAYSSMPVIGKRQTLMLSATFPGPIQKLAHDFLDNERLGFIQVGEIGSANPCIDQHFENVSDLQETDGRYRKLIELLSKNPVNVDIHDDDAPGNNKQRQKTIIFAETKDTVDRLSLFLANEKFSATSYSGRRTQKQREKALREFKDGVYAILVVTGGLGSRGLDIPNVEHVINYDLPVSTVLGNSTVVKKKSRRETHENRAIAEYVQRIGRTGRVGNRGRATSFYDSQRDKDLANHLVKILVGVQQVIPPFIHADAGTSGLVIGFGGRFSPGDGGWE